MALTETQENDKIEVVNRWHVQVRKASIVKKDGKEIARSFERFIYNPGILDASDNLVETDISGLDDDVKAVCNAVWTDTVKNDYKAFLISRK
tara:strand:+ start:1342 stop:1617 length:276 start_codon:yes stop_codon:yes gene_type:complete